jgi:hypothetical protein
MLTLPIKQTLTGLSAHCSPFAKRKTTMVQPHVKIASACYITCYD